ncbi:chemotaxis protein [Malaciobacter molluscorum LMG 25693]|uniref:Cache sensor-containing MCP-domain signal transduction protein n=1 Tax=Malaciobacter molluscorum LMG 25693 TaxID=870501 RepID=A0A2G1DKB0_9BACT|nr:methyl-accepting chemotaxis protein [Malaciobacter molluscorum]AXX91338.1 Cache sensor-containing MCP-domain signal transduction protein [Malaciobacter molluscorum LMG 25693]PHO18909.1 chemotaxis protein [Malaciobacter molluscorum LMG 25693]
MRNLSIKNKILSIVTISIVLTFLISIIIMALEFKKLAQYQKNDFSKLVNQTAKEELKAFGQLAETSIDSYLKMSTESAINEELSKDIKSLETLTNELYMKNNSIEKDRLVLLLNSTISKNKNVTIKSGKNVINSNDKNNNQIIKSFYFSKLDITIYIKAFIKDIQESYKKDAANVLSNLRFLGNGYFYGVEVKKDKSAWYVVDGSKFKRFGKRWDLTHKDKKGRPYRKQILDNLENNSEGITFVPYVFFNPKTKQLNEKLAIGKRIDQWNWVIITGIYLTDMNEKIESSYASAVNNIKDIIKYLTITIAILSIIILLIISYFVSRYIKKELNSFQTGLVTFFKFLNREATEVKLLTNDSKDEIGNMSKIINDNINKSKENLEKRNAFLLDVENIVKEIKKGYLVKRLDKKMDDESLEELRKNFNEMLDTLSKNIGNDTNIILDILDKLSKNDFRNKISDENGKIPFAINNVINLINNMLNENKNDGLQLDKSSNNLLKYVDSLNQSSSNAATSLEETSAAVEEITGNIRNNTNNIIKMSDFATSLKNSSTKGEKLASKTTTSMEEINEQTNSIADAITIIDQIAFQTNILSLNAAVEAATAGEAGKGFAIVAQEVRNLASRSAQAAKEIKELVDNATVKTNEGKKISIEMIEGYEELNSDLQKTIEIIKDIENASKEQLIGIEQINNAINTLDAQTQENATMATQTTEVAHKTSTIAHKILNSVNEKEFIGK